MLWDATTTNYVVSVLAQISAILIVAAIKSLLGIVRTALVLRPQGSSLATWARLGSSDWWTIVQFAWANSFLNPWCNIRTIIKFQAEFDYYFVVSNNTIEVYAGLVLPNIQMLEFFEATEVAMFFVTWGAVFLSNPMFAVEFSMPGCPVNAGPYCSLVA
ncbi:hypothetical protein QBC35DRAFT_82563 [Podospora australis]|uniref:Uncharacterized protein n=1 Tax=Podospora australis TaxID=1536484 RepID=A0AAN6WLK7_9PEZI|nr:hypothetical protein QBC35DRAFT_82563 [Podospora australis]